MCILEKARKKGTCLPRVVGLDVEPLFHLKKKLNAHEWQSSLTYSNISLNTSWMSFIIILCPLHIMISHWSTAIVHVHAASVHFPPCCAQGFATDVCVPISRLPEVLLQTREDISASSITGVPWNKQVLVVTENVYWFHGNHSGPIIGHVGDGNFHTLMLVDPENAEELATIKQLSLRMARYACWYGQVRNPKNDNVTNSKNCTKFISRTVYCNWDLQCWKCKILDSFVGSNCDFNLHLQVYDKTGIIWVLFLRKIIKLSVTMLNSSTSLCLWFMVAGGHWQWAVPALGNMEWGAAK